MDHMLICIPLITPLALFGMFVVALLNSDHQEDID